VWVWVCGGGGGCKCEVREKIICKNMRIIFPIIKYATIEHVKCIHTYESIVQHANFCHAKQLYANIWYTYFCSMCVAIIHSCSSNKHLHIHASRMLYWLTRL